MKLKRIFALFVTVALMLTTITIPVQAEDVKPHGYDNLNNDPGDLVIGFLGGSITVADGDSNSQGFNRYATRVTNWFQDKYPAKTVKQVNAGIGGTGSDLGKYRVMTDIGAYAPDVVFVEYAVNDTHYSRLYSETVRSNMETIVRTLQSLPKVPVIVFLYSMHDDSYAKLNYTSIPDHQAVADYYGIECIDFYNYMKPLVEKGDFVWDKTKPGTLTNDNIHPNALGHEQYGNYIISQLESRNILRKNNTGLSRKFEFTTKDTRDIKFKDADDFAKTGTWNDAFSGQSDDKYEALQATANGDSISFSYTSNGNDTLGVTVLNGKGTFVVDEGTGNEISGELTGSGNNLPSPKEFVSGLSAGKHTVKIVNTGDGETVGHLKLGRIIANGGLEINAASTYANGDHIPGSKPANLMQGGQTGNIIGTGNNGNVGYTEYKQDYTGNGSIYKFSATGTVTKGSWGGEGVNFRRLDENTVATSSGILYDGYTAKQDTYVFKTRARALAGTPRIGSATTISWVPTYDNIYKGDGFIPGEEWVDYKTTLTSAGDGFTLCFGFSNAVAGDAFLVDFGDGVYYAPEVAYDVKVKPTGATSEIIAGGKSTYKAELLNQIEIPATSVAQTFTWSVVDASGNTVEGLTATAGASSNEVTVNADSEVPFGTYYLKAVSTATNWQKTLPVEVVEGPADPYAKDHVAGEKPANLFQDPTSAYIVASNVPTASLNAVSHSDYASYCLTAKVDIAASGTNYNKGLVGTQLLANNYANVSFPEKFTAGKAYVYSFEAINYGTTDSFVYNMALGTNNGWTANWSVERGADGFVISDKENWTTVAGTLVMKGTAGDNTATTYLCSGFQNAKAGSAIRIRHSQSSHPYLAEEKPYDIFLSGKNGTVIVPGENAVFEAKIVNQINSTGTLSQDKFSFTVGDAKGIEVDGLTVTNSGAAATVSATDEVAEGKYYLRAKYPVDENTTWIRTLEIEVKGAIENTDDYVVGEMPPNLITNPKNSSFWYSKPTYINHTNVQTTNEWTGDGFAGYAFKTTGTVVAADGWQIAAGSRLISELFNEYTAKTGEHYVIRFAARSLTENTGAGIRIGTWNGAFSGRSSDVSQIMDYENGIAQLPGDGEWHTIKGTLPALRAEDIEESGKVRMIVVGMAVGTPADVTVEFNNHYKAIPDDVPYFAKETAYDIKVSGNSETVAAGEAMNLSAFVENQIGTKGALAQSFDWVAVTTDRMNYVDGITFTPSNDGANVTVNVADTVAPGNYLVVAQNKTYGMNRQYPITVLPAPEYDVTELTLDTAEDTATLCSLVVKSTESVKVVIAAFRGLKLAASNETVLTPDGGVATLTDPLAIDGLENGDKVRVFVWDMDLTPFTMKNLYKQFVTIE